MASQARMNAIRAITPDTQTVNSHLALQTLVTKVNSEIEEYFCRPYNQKSLEYENQPTIECLSDSKWKTIQQSLIKNDTDKKQSNFDPSLFSSTLEEIISLKPKITEDGMGDGTQSTTQASSKKPTYSNPMMREFFDNSKSSQSNEDYVVNSFTGLKLGRVFLHSQLVTSTHSLMTGPLYSLPSYSVFLTDNQRNGRGRGGNIWISTPGCLMVNISLPVKSGTLLPFVQYLIGWAIVKAITTIPTLEDLPLRIKWPNDIYIGDKKAGGILCQSSMIPAMSHDDVSPSASDLTRPDFENHPDPTFLVHAGFGLNITSSGDWACINDAIEQLNQPQTARKDSSSASLASVTSLFSSLSVGLGFQSAPATTSTSTSDSNPGRPLLSREVVLARTLYFLNGGINIFNTRGFAPFEGEYIKYWLHSGARVKVEGHPNHCIITGLAPSGFLRAIDETDSTVELELHPDGNSFDLSQNFIKSKRL